MLDSEWLGRRVTVRRVVERAPDGRLLQADVVGELIGLDAQTAVVEGRDGPVEIPVAYVTAARLAAPATRDELDLQDVAARGLRPLYSRELDGWSLRADPARPRRVNSVLPGSQLHMPLDDALAQVSQWYAGFDKAALVLVPYPARRLLDAALDERGWAYEAPAVMLACALDRLQAGQDVAPAVRVDTQPDDAWLALSGGDRDLLARHDTVAFASVREGTDVLAVARGCVDDRWLGISGLVVAEAHRRRGLATTLTAALAGWARGHGARRSYLQVEADNVAARALYERLGYWPHHEYHYRRSPEASLETP